MKKKNVINVLIGVSILVVLFITWQTFMLSLQLMNQPYNYSVFLGMVCALGSLSLAGYALYLVWVRSSKLKKENKETNENE